MARKQCDYCKSKPTKIYDAPTKRGPWAFMCPQHWRMHRRYDTLGTGRGQVYDNSGTTLRLLQGGFSIVPPKPAQSSEKYVVLIVDRDDVGAPYDNIEHDSIHAAILVADELINQTNETIVVGTTNSDSYVFRYSSVMQKWYWSTAR